MAIVAYCYTDPQFLARVLPEIQAQHREVLTFHQPVNAPFAYAQDLRQLWAMDDDVILVEQDVIPPENAIDQLLRCAEPWCTHPHWLGVRYCEDSLGLVKWSRELKRLRPDLFAQAIGARPGQPWGAHHTACDVKISRVLTINGIRPHVHPTPTRHLHEYYPVDLAQGPS